MGRSRRNMAQRRCGCGQPVSDGFLCTTCTTELTTDLRNLPHRIGELEDTAYRLDRIASAGGGGGSGNRVRPLPYRPEVTPLLDRARNLLTTWARDTLEHRGLDPEHLPSGRKLPSSTAGLCDWLARQVPSIRLSPQVVEMRRDLERLEADIASATDLPPSPIYLGPCDVCKRPMYAKRGDELHLCQTKGCASPIYRVTERVAELLHRSRGMTAMPSTIATALTSLDTPMSETRIKRWRDAGKLAPVKHDARGRPFYLLADVLDLVEWERKRNQLAAVKRAGLGVSP